MAAIKANLTKPKVLLFGRIGQAHKAFESFTKDFNVVRDDSKNREQFIHELDTNPEYQDITGVYSNYDNEKRMGSVDDALVEHFPSTLKYFCHAGAGYDYVHANALLNKGIQMSNTPNPVMEATATTAIYLIIGALRNFNALAVALRKGNFKKGVPLAHDPKNKVLGILGMGSIGKSIRDKAVPFKFSKIVYHNRRKLPQEEEGEAQFVADYDDFLSMCDVIAVSVPLNKNTRHLVNAESLQKCKDGVVIVNTARGPVIDEEALVQALDSGKVRSVGLDVFEFEPKVHPKLMENPNVLLLPHAGTYTVETSIETEERCMENVRVGIEKGRVLDLVSEQQGKI